MKTVITYGTFDMLHYGHIKLLRRAKTYGDYLIVGLSTDNFNKLKGKNSYFSYEDRKIFVEAIKFVDLIIPENDWSQKITDVEKYKVNTFIIGDDWKGKFDFLSSACSVVYIERTPGVSTTGIKSIVG
jgi:glycerol-3-phosphate cytidylyltransferase